MILSICKIIVDLLATQNDVYLLNLFMYLFYLSCKYKKKHFFQGKRKKKEISLFYIQSFYFYSLLLEFT